MGLAAVIFQSTDIGAALRQRGFFLIDPFRLGAGGPSVWNPATAGTNNGMALSGGNLIATATDGFGGVAGAQGHTYASGPWSFEVTVGGPDNWSIGIGNSAAIGSPAADTRYPGENSQGFAYYGNGSKVAVTLTAYGASYTAGDVIGVYLAADGKITFYKNGASQGVAFDLFALGYTTPGQLWYPMFGSGTSGTGVRTGTLDTTAVLGGATAWG